MQVLELLAVLPLSNTFLSLPALSCPFMLITILPSPLVDGWTGGQGDLRTYGHTDGWTDRRNSILQDVYRRKKGADTHTHTDTQTFNSIIILDI